MTKRRNVVSATAAQENGTVSLGTVATGMVQRRKRQTHQEIRNEGYDYAVRVCAEALLNYGESRDYVEEVFCFRGIPFPSTDDTDWDVSWAFEDWDDWVAAEESESET